MLLECPDQMASLSQIKMDKCTYLVYAEYHGWIKGFKYQGSIVDLKYNSHFLVIYLFNWFGISNKSEALKNFFNVFHLNELKPNMVSKSFGK